MRDSDNSLRNNIMQLDAGSIFFPTDFYYMASSEAVRKTLSRMVANGEVFRLSRGIYCRPRSNKLLGIDFIPPSIDSIAQRVAERDRISIVPTGDYALNRLGLSTQVPGNAVYLTNGAKKRIKLWNGASIVFRESNELRIFDFLSNVMSLIVSAMRSIGEEHLTKEMIQKFKTLASTVPEDVYRKDLLLAPIWVRKKLEG